MTNSPRRHTPIDLADIMLDCGTAIRLRGRDDYIVRQYLLDDVATPASRRNWRPVSRVAETLGLWRRHYLTRRHLRLLDRRGLADIGIDPIERDREAGKPFWKL